MAKVKPFKGIRPPRELVTEVASRPYDVLNSDEARREAEGNPRSLYHIIKPEIDFDPSVDEHDPRVYDKAVENFKAFRRNGWLVQDEKEHYYIYAQTMDGRTQYGIVIAAKNAEKAAKLNDAFQGKADAKSVAAGAAAEAVKADAPAASAAPAAEATTASDLNGKRVLVLCQGGGTSGLLANALAKAAKERGINLETAAEAYGNHVDMLPEFDLVVLAPQAASYLADLQKDCERVGNKCVACRGKQYIELSQNGDKSLAFVSEQLSK